MHHAHCSDVWYDTIIDQMKGQEAVEEVVEEKEEGVEEKTVVVEEKAAVVEERKRG